MERRLLHLDQAYSLAASRQRKQTHFLEARNRNGIFSRVLSVHPLIGVMGNRWATRLDRQALAPGHDVVDGFVEGVRFPKLLIPINFIWSQIRLVFWAARTIRREQIDLIYAADAFYLGALAVILKRLTGRPAMIGIMGNWDLAYETAGALAYPRLLRFRSVEQALLRWVLKRVDWIEIAAEDSARYVQRYGADPAKFIRLPVVKFIGAQNYVPPAERPSAAVWLRACGIPDDALRLICVSRLRPVKYSLDALEAMLIVLEAEPSVVAIFAGDGELRDEIERRIAALGLTDRIFLPGNIDQITLASLLPGSIALSPLTGMALIETSLAAAPPVVYDVEWQPEFVRDGVNGFVVPFRNAQAMGKAALRLVQDTALRLAFRMQPARARWPSLIPPPTRRSNERLSRKSLRPSHPASRRAGLRRTPMAEAGSPKLVAIHQPNFFPWLGYFDKIRRADRFIFLDDVQYEKKGGNWGNRVQLLNNGEPRWTTAPVERNYHGFRTVAEMRFDAATPWRDKMVRMIADSGRKAPYLAEALALIEPVIRNPEDRLAVYNIQAVRTIGMALGLNAAKLRLASELNVGVAASTARLVALTRAAGGDAYLVGGGAGGYQEDELFTASGLTLEYQGYRPRPYPQVGAVDFVPGLSVIDALMNLGIAGTRALLEREEPR